MIWMAAEEIARGGVDGAEAGKRVVVPGALNRAGSLLGRTPRAGVAAAGQADLGPGV